MTATETLDAACDRERMVELSYSLYECLSDLITDCESLAYAIDPDTDGLVERISISAMNCLADMKLLRPVFTAVSNLRG